MTINFPPVKRKRKNEKGEKKREREKKKKNGDLSQRSAGAAASIDDEPALAGEKERTVTSLDGPMASEFLAFLLTDERIASRRVASHRSVSLLVI